MVTILQTYVISAEGEGQIQGENDECYRKEFSL